MGIFYTLNAPQTLSRTFKPRKIEDSSYQSRGTRSVWGI